jgi:hypothetical protein
MHHPDWGAVCIRPDTAKSGFQTLQNMHLRDEAPILILRSQITGKSDLRIPYGTVSGR